MTRKRISFVERSSLERVHKESLRVLENVGVRVADPECLKVLKRNGARVHGQSDIVRLPGEMVKEALNQVTKTYELVNAHGVRHAMPAGCHPHVPDRKRFTLCGLLLCGGLSLGRCAT